MAARKSEELKEDFETANRTDMKKIGFIGTGLMSRGMARSLIRKGHSVRIYNRTRAKAEEVAQSGGEVVDTPAEAAKEADVIVTMLADPTAVLAVVEGAEGVLTSVRPGAVLIDSSTISPPTTLHVMKQLHVKRAHMLDAPVFGSKNEAEKGELGFIVGGDREVLAQVQDVLDCLDKTFYALPCSRINFGPRMFKRCQRTFSLRKSSVRSEDCWGRLDRLAGCYSVGWLVI
jgi:6-phosphogluconate dehydrogenase